MVFFMNQPISPGSNVLDQLFLKRPVRIQKIIDERGRDDADCLVDLRDAAGINDRQYQEGGIADRQGYKGNDVELQAADMDLVVDVPVRKGPEVVQEKIRNDGNLDRDRRSDEFVQTHVHEDGERDQVDDDPGGADNRKFEEGLAPFEPDPPCVQHEFDDVGKSQLGLPSFPVYELDRDLLNVRVIDDRLME